MAVLISITLLCLPLSHASAIDGEASRHIPREWLETAEKAERMLEAPQSRRDLVTADQWEDLRLTLTVQRELAQRRAATGTLQSRILSAQLVELGERTKSSPEPLWLKAKRTRLETMVAAEDAPVEEARDFHARASVLIKDIDDAQMQQRRRALFVHGHSILSYATWQEPLRGRDALSALPQSISDLALARIFGAAVAGAAALWAAYLTRRVARRHIDARSQAMTSPRARLGAAFVRDLVDIAAPGAALLVLYVAIRSIAYEHPGSALIAGTVLSFGLAIIFARWLAHSLFAPAFPAARLVVLPEQTVHSAIRLMAMLGAILAADDVGERIAVFPGGNPAAGSLISTAVILAGSVITWLLARILKRAQGSRAALREQGTGLKQSTPANVLVPVSRCMAAISVLAAMAALTGYVELASHVLMALLWSLAITATALFLYRSLTEAAALLFADTEQLRSRYFQLVPLLFGFLLALIALPLIAISWGINPEVLVDGILALKNGVALGEVRLSFGSVMTFGLVFLLGYALTRWLQRILFVTVLDRLCVDLGARAAVLTGVGYIGLTLSALVAITAAGLDLSSLAFIAGALSVGIGFGLQSVVANFVSGIILLIERPIKEGDWIEVAGYSGHVRKVAFRSTHIETFDRHEVIIPNSELVSGSVTNLTYGGSEGRIVLPVGVAYSSDIEAASVLLTNVAKAHPQVLHEPAPRVILDRLGESSVELNLMCFVENVNQRLTVRSDLNFSIVKALGHAGIAIPFPQREIWLRGAPLRDRPAPG